MALFKIFKGQGLLEDLNEKRPSTVEGYCYFTPQDGKFYIDIVDDDNLENNPAYDPRKRVVLNAAYADYAYLYANGKVGDESIPIYINSAGQPLQCGSILSTNISGGLVNANGELLDIGNSKLPIYFSDGRPVVCDNTLNINITGNAPTADHADEATHAASADEAQKSHGAYYLLNQENNSSLDVGNINTPVYFINGVPTPCNTLKLPSKGDSDTPIYIDNNGIPQSCVDFLPLTAGASKKISGPLGLTLNQNYGLSLPNSGFEGEIFFVEDQRDWLYLPTGGSAGQILIKNSNTDGDVTWKNPNYLSLSGGNLTGPLSSPYYVTSNYGNTDPTSSTPGYGVNGALYFKIIS